MEGLTRLLAVVCACLGWTGSWAYPDGNLLPLTVCNNLKPKSAVGVDGMEGHLLMAQNHMPGKKRIAPFYMHINESIKFYDPSAEIQVSVIANQTTGTMFYKGIILQAREVYCHSNDTIEVGEEPLGSFIVKSLPDRPAHLLATMDCTGKDSKSAVRHRTPAMKINETVTWKAPKDHSGNIVFWATIVQQGNVHWTRVHSRVLMDPLGDKVPACGVDNLKASLLITALTLLTALWSSSSRML